MPSFPKRYADAVARLRVPIGFLLVILFAWFSRPAPASLSIGLSVSLVGLALRGWAAGCLYKDRDLATWGPYAYTRNPLYLGTLLVAAGFAIAARNWWLGALFAMVFASIYLPAIELEQQHLGDLFPEHPEYARRVPLLLPRWPAAKPPKQRPFRWTQYRKNREYQAAAAFAVGAAWLIYRGLA